MYTWARAESSLVIRPLSVMICISFRMVVYAPPRPMSSATSRTVLDPRVHSTRRIASSASVGFLDGLTAPSASFRVTLFPGQDVYARTKCGQSDTALARRSLDAQSPVRSGASLVLARPRVSTKVVVYVNEDLRMLEWPRASRAEVFQRCR